MLDESTPLAGIDDAAITAPSTLAADDAYAEAGLGPDDLDVVECQDTDAARELLSWTELGLCDPGDQRRLLRRPGCRRVASTEARPSTGPAACCPRASRWGRPASARWSSWSASSGAEAATARSPDARIGLAHTIGRGANASVTIVSR